MVFPSRVRRAADIWGGGLQTVPVSMDASNRRGSIRTRGPRLPGSNQLDPGRLVGWDFTVAEALNLLSHALREGPYSQDDAESG
jgi:hypothetical protein